MRSTKISAVAFCALVALAGCSSDSGEASGSAENADVCTQFAAAHDELAKLAEAGPADNDIDQWTADKAAVMDEFRTLAEQASGDVQTDVQTLAAALPADSLELTEPDSASGQAFVDNSAAVASSCDSDGTPITLAEFPLLSF